MSKSVLYAVNTASQAIGSTAGVITNFGSIVRNYGCNAYLSGGNVIIKGRGYYDVDANLSLTATAAGTAVVFLYKDGVKVPGATAIVSMAIGDTVSVTIPAIVRDLCDCEVTLTVIVSGITGTINNAAIDVIKL